MSAKLPWIVAIGLALLAVWSSASVPPAQAQTYDPTADAELPMIRALRQLGCNLSAPNRVIGTIIDQAPDLVAMVVRDDPAVLLDDARFLNRLRGLTDRGMHGERVFGSWSADDLRAVTTRLRQADPQTDPGAAALALRLYQDPVLAGRIYTVNLHGGLSESFRNIQLRQAANRCIEWVDAPGDTANCLEYLLR